MKTIPYFFNGGMVKSKGADIYPRILSSGIINSIAGDTLTIKSQITNSGDTPTGSFKVCFYYKRKESRNNIKIGDTIITGLPAYESTIVNKNYVLPIGGLYYTKVTTDEGFQVFEANENNNSDNDSIKVKQHILEVNISSPSTGAQVMRSNIKLTGSSEDNNFGPIPEYNLLWTSDKDGILGNGDTLFVDTLSAGVHIISLTATNTTGKSKTSSIIIEAFEPGVPVVKITTPLNNCNIPAMATSRFTALANDYSEGKLENCEWWSDKEGSLGTGSSIAVVLTKNGQHKIKVKAVNNLNVAVFDSITVSVVEGYPTLKLTRPVSSTYTQEKVVDFKAFATDPKEGDISKDVLWISDIEGILGKWDFISREMMPGNHKITASIINNEGFTNDTSFNLTIGFTPPVAEITEPATFKKYRYGEPIILKGRATDIQDLNIASNNLEWESSLQGFLGIGDSLHFTDLIPGYHIINLRAIDNDGATGDFKRQIYIEKTAPNIISSYPPSGAVFYSSSEISFSVYATDEEDGLLTGNSVDWTSSLDGNLGTGTPINIIGLSSGLHTIRIIATDSDGNSSQKDVELEIRESRPPSVRIKWPVIPVTIAHSVGASLKAEAYDPEEGVMDSTSIIWHSNIDGIIGYGSELEHIFTSTGTHQITVSVIDSAGYSHSAISSITVTQQIPTQVQIISPSYGSYWTTADSIVFSGSADDYEDGSLTGEKLIWTSDIDGLIGSGVSFKTRLLSAGAHTIKLTATDSNGASKYTNIRITVDELVAPEIQIIDPLVNTTSNRGSEVTFLAIADDFEDGEITDRNIFWSSNLDGKIGMGSTFIVDNLSIGNHVISATAIDSHGLTTTATTQISVINNKPSVSITSPGNNSTYLAEQTIEFSGVSSDEEDGEIKDSNLVWISNIDGQIGQGNNINLSDLSLGEHCIRLTATDSDEAINHKEIIISIIPITPPSISISSPTNYKSIIHGDNVEFIVNALDCQNISIENENIIWNSTIDGFLGNGRKMETKYLSVGEHTISIIANDNFDQSANATIILSVVQASPTVIILNPTNNYISANTKSISFQGSGIDLEDGNLAGTSLIWSSDRDGQIGIGNSFTSQLSVGKHTIELTGIDSQGATNFEQIHIYITSQTSGVILTTPDNKICLDYTTPDKDTIIYFKLPRNAKVSTASCKIKGVKSTLKNTLSSEIILKDQAPKSTIEDYNENLSEYYFSDGVEPKGNGSLDLLASSNVPEIERQALISLYNSTSGANWKNNTNWCSSEIVSLWHGITVENGHVTKIKLSSNNLNGVIPNEIGNLTYLITLDLKQNYFTNSKLPAELSNLVNLRYLFIDNFFSDGSFPVCLLSLVNLEKLLLHGTTYSLPSDINKLRSLIALSMRVGGTIPPSLFSLPKLEFACFMGGSITSLPEEIDNAPKLKYLSFQYNNISMLPSTIKNLSESGTYINLNANNLTFEDFEPLKKIIRFTPENEFPDPANHKGSLNLTRLNIWPWTSTSYMGHASTLGQKKVGSPSTNSVELGSSFTFSITVGGANNSYQWVKDGIPIPGATSSTLIVDNIQLEDEGIYRCIISNSQITNFDLSSHDMILSILEVYPTNPLLDIGNNNTYEWSYAGEFKSSITTYSLTNAINDYLEAYAGVDPIVNVPFRIRYSKGGKLEFCNFNIQYTTVDTTPPTIVSTVINPNPVDIDNGLFEVSAVVEDNVYVESVEVKYDLEVYSLIYKGDNVYFCILPIVNAGVFDLEFIAKDNSSLETRLTKNAIISTKDVDLAVDRNSILFNQTEIKEGELVNVTCNIRNNGNVEANNATIAILVNNSLYNAQNITVPSLGQSEVNFSWSPAILDYEITIVADYDNKFDETIESDNSASISVTPKDLTPPLISGIDFMPCPGIVQDTILINAFVEDNVGVDKVECNFNGEETTMSYNSINNAYSVNAIAANTGTAIATLKATDINGLISTKSKVCQIFSQMPDLSITQGDVYLPDEFLGSGQDIPIKLNVHNRGGKLNQNFSIKLFVDNKVADIKNITINPNSVIEVSFTWSLQCGIHTISFIVDEENLIAESNEENNTVTIPINLCHPLPPVISNLIVKSLPVLESDNFTLSANIDFSEKNDSVIATFNNKNYRMTNTSGDEYTVDIFSGQSGINKVSVIAYDRNGQLSEAGLNISIVEKENDLWLDNNEISLMPKLIEERDLVDVSSIIHNNGNQDVKEVLSYLYVNNKLIDSTYVSIPANEQKVAVFKWQAEYQHKQLKIIIDPDNQIDEENELNNSTIVDVTVIDNTHPIIIDVKANPNPVEKGAEVNIILYAKDNTSLLGATYTWQGDIDTLVYNPINEFFETSIVSEDTGTYLLNLTVEDITGFETHQDKSIRVIQQLADLSINNFDISWSNDSSGKNDTVQLYLNVHNFGGSVAQNLEVIFSVDRKIIETKLITLSSYTQELLSFNWPVLSGNHEFSFVVDKTNKIPELNEFNNFASQSLSFYDPLPPVITEAFCEPFGVRLDSVFTLKAKIIDADGINSVVVTHQSQDYNLVFNSLSGYYESELKNSNTTGNKNILVKTTDVYGLTCQEQVSYNSLSLQSDLSFISVKQSSVLSIAGLLQVADITIYNSGVAQIKDILAVLYQNNIIVDSARIVVGAESSYDFALFWTPLYGTQTLRVLLDPTNELTESDETNNQWSQIVEGIDNQPPSIRKVTVSENIFVGEPFTISASITDNIKVSNVTVTYNSNNYSMAYDSSSMEYRTSIPKSLLSNLQFTISASDISGLKVQQEILLSVKDSLPDIMVNPFDIDINLSKNNKQASIKSKIRNIGGSKAINTFVRLFCNDIKVDSIDIDIPRGEIFIWAQSIDIMLGKNTITIETDPYNVISEIDETNNVAVRKFTNFDITPPLSPVPLCTPFYWSNVNNFQIHWNNVDDILDIKNYWYNLNNSEWISVGRDTSISLTVIETGEYKFYVKAEDMAGNFSNPEVTELLFDSIRPETPILEEKHCGLSWTIHSSPLLSWNNPNDKGSGVNKFIVLINEEQTIELGDIHNYHVILNKSGEHTFRVKAIDRAGNESALSNKVKVYIDHNYPSQSQICSYTHPSQNKWYNSDSACFNWTVPEDMSSVKGYYYILNKDSSTVPNNYSFWYSDTSIVLNSLPFNTGRNVRIPEGNWYFHLTAMDEVGQIDTIGAHYKINIDRSPPHTRRNNELSAKCGNKIYLSTEDYLSGVNKTYFKVNQEEWHQGSEITLTKDGYNLVQYYSIDNAGNIESVNIDTILNTRIVITHKVKHISCRDKNDGNIKVEVSGGNSPYKYLWSNNITTKSNTNLGKGIYKLIVTDWYGCKANMTDTIVEPLFLMDVTTYDDFNSNCNGEAHVSITEGTPPFRYHWSESCYNNKPIAKHLCFGTYTVKVTDANKCSLTDTFQINDYLTNTQINDIEQKRCIIHPNPTTGYFSINLAGIRSKKVYVTILNVEGELFFEREYDFNYQLINISINDLPDNIYIMKIKLDNEHFIKELVKIGN